MCLVTRDSKSNIIVLDKVSDIFLRKWYKEKQKEILNDEFKRIVKTVAKLIREPIRNFDRTTSTYQSTDKNHDTKNHAPELLKFFVNEIVCSPVKQNLISQN